MRHLAPVLLCLLLAACGGDFSNDDLEFLNALPLREDLAAKLPESAARAGNGLTPREDGLVGLQGLGIVSDLAVQTYSTGTGFNQSVDALLSLLEKIRKLPPTTREPDRRVWGPFPDDKHPSLDVRFVMERTGEVFTYLLQYRRSGAGEEAWWTFIPGSFKADAGIRKGTGTVSMDFKEARKNGFPADGAVTLDRLDIDYQTRALPTRVALLFTGLGRPTPEVTYTYRAVPEGLGEMKFRLPDTDLVPGGLRETLDVTTRWAADGRGMVVVDILAGDATGAKYTECWDTRTRVTFIRRNWDWFNPPEGDATACPDVSALE